MKAKTEKTTKWKSGLSVVAPEIYLEWKLSDFLKAVVKQAEGDDELSILLKGDWNDYYKGWLVGLEYYIPIQEVGCTSVDYHKSYPNKVLRDKALAVFKEEGKDVSAGEDDEGVPHVKENLYKLRDKGFNTIVHSHPFSKANCSFSSADKEFINSNYPCSILLDKEGEAVMGSLMLPTTSKKLRMRVETDRVIRLVVREQIDIIGLENIYKKPKALVVQEGCSRHTRKNKQRLFYGKHEDKTLSSIKDALLDSNYEDDMDGLMDIGDDKYLGNGVWESCIEAEIQRLVKEENYDEDEIRSWFRHYTHPENIAGVIT